MKYTPQASVSDHYISTEPATGSFLRMLGNKKEAACFHKQPLPDILLHFPTDRVTAAEKSNPQIHPGTHFLDPLASTRSVRQVCLR